MPWQPTPEQARLFEVHAIRMRAHWGKKYDASVNWPQTRAEWAAVEHGSPCDTNVHMARWHLKVACEISDAGRLTRGNR